MGQRFRVIAAAVIAAFAVSACAGSPARDSYVRGASDPLPGLIDESYDNSGPQLVRLGTPQSCVPYARSRSGIDIRGDAYLWWNEAAGRYAREPMPLTGSVMVLTGYAGPKHGHVAVVTRIVSNREIRVDHANWMNDGNLYLNSPVIDVSPANDWTQVRVWNTRDGHLGGTTYRVTGFISPTRVAGS